VKRQRDSQRSKLYAWERQYVDGRPTWASWAERHETGKHPKMTLAECQALVNKVWRSYFGPGPTPPEVKDGRGSRRALAGFFHISLPRWARTRHSVLHEVTHSILDRSCRYDLAGHGPEFVRIYCELLVRYDGRKLGELTRSARASRLKVASPSAYEPATKWEKEAQAHDNV